VAPLHLLAAKTAASLGVGRTQRGGASLPGLAGSTTRTAALPLPLTARPGAAGLSGAVVAAVSALGGALASALGRACARTSASLSLGRPKTLSRSLATTFAA